jgi:hypothetical protein
MIISIIILLVFPSNLFFPYSYVNILKPINYNLNDYSAPYTNYKLVPETLINEMKNTDNILISLFSLDVEYYIRKPDYVIPFSMDGMGEDQISFINKNKEVVDIYSGALILNYSDSAQITNIKSKSYYVSADSFSLSKLKPIQKSNFNQLIENCSIEYSDSDLKIYSCKK